jgi:hypothetical protein
MPEHHAANWRQPGGSAGSERQHGTGDRFLATAKLIEDPSEVSGRHCPYREREAWQGRI